MNNLLNTINLCHVLFAKMERRSQNKEKGQRGRKEKVKWRRGCVDKDERVQKKGGKWDEEGEEKGPVKEKKQ